MSAFALFLAWVLACDRRAALAAGVVSSPEAAMTSASVPDRRRYDIPAGALGPALDAYAATSGLAIRLDVPNELRASVSSPGCAGVYTTEEALSALLAGTGLVGSVGEGAARIRFEYEDAVHVEGPAPSGLSDSLAKYQAPLREIPQSIDVVDAEVMEQQQVTELADALRNVPGISLAAGEGGFQGDALSIRGFSARGDLYLDGMRDFASYYRDPYAIEEVQVLKGPSGMTFGRGSTGGVVNQTTKLPRLERFGAAELELGTDRTRRLTLDVSEPLENLGPGTALRLAALAHDGDVAGRDVAESRRLGVAPSLAFGLGSPTRLTLAHYHQDADDIPDYGVPWFFDTPADVPRGSYYGFRDGNHLETDVDVSTVKVEHDFGTKLTLRNEARYASSTRRALITEPRIEGYTHDTPFEDILVTRQQIDASSEETLLQDQLDLIGNVSTGRVRHALVGGVEVTRETSSPLRRTWRFVPGTPLLDPDPDDEFAGTSSVSSDVDVEAKSLAAYVVDTLQVTKRLSFVAGLRWDRFDAEHENAVATPCCFDRVDEETTWRAGVVFEPRENGSIYASAATSFNPSAEGLALSASTADTEPERGRAFEVGTKWTLGHGRVDLRGAVFVTHKTDVREPDRSDPLQQVNSGAQRVRGFEVEVDGQVTKRWNLMAGYAFLDGEVTESKFTPAGQGPLIGEPLANVPRHTFSAWSLHELPWKLELGWGLRHVSSRTASSTAPRDPVTRELKQAPGYWTADAMLSRPLANGWSLQLNLANLSDELYHDQLHPGHVVPGAGRSAALGLRFEWPMSAH